MTRNENTLDAGGDRIEGAEQTKPSTPIVAQTTSGAQPPRSNGTEPPAVGGDELPKALQDLAGLPIWVYWRRETRDGKPTKVPYKPNGKGKASTTNPLHWSTYTKAAIAAQRYNGNGVGIVFHPETIDLVGVDVDHCLNEDGTLSPAAVDVVALLNTYTELSPSGTGLHCLMRGSYNGTGRKNTEHGVELYQAGRYFTVTGDHVDGTPDAIEDRTAELATLVERYFTEPAKPTRTTRTAEAGSPPAATKEAKPTKAPLIADPPFTTNLTDAEVITACENEPSGDVFRRLYYKGDCSGYKSESEADGALSCFLARHTNVAAQIERIMCGSKLPRGKWDRPDYLPRTIATALAKVDTVPPHSDFGVDVADVDPETGEILDGTRSRIPKEATAPDGFTLSEVGNAHRFAARNTDNVLYTDATGWLVWDGCRYSRTSTEEVLNAIEVINQELYGMVQETGDRVKFIRQILAFERANSLRGSETLARGLAALRTTADTLDVDRYLINFTNGTFNVRAGELRPHRREDKITRLVPCDYNPTARCPVWIDALHGIFARDPEPAASVAGLQRLLGYAITGVTKERIIAFFIGAEGRNGKTTILNALMTVLGPDYVKAARTEVLMAGGIGRGATPDLAALRGVRVVTLSETESEGRLNSNLVKALTGNEPVSARELYKDPINFEPEFTPFVATNNEPVVDGRDQALFARLVYIPFKRQFVLESENPDADPADFADLLLEDKLEAEREGIAAWLVEGAVAWYREIAAGRSTGLLIPPHWRREKENFQRSSDSVGQFVSEGCVREPGARETSGKLYDAYKVFCADAGIKEVSRRQFSKTLDQMGYVLERDARHRYIAGLRLDLLFDHAQEDPE